MAELELTSTQHLALQEKSPLTDFTLLELQDIRSVSDKIFPRFFDYHSDIQIEIDEKIKADEITEAARRKSYWSSYLYNPSAGKSWVICTGYHLSRPLELNQLLRLRDHEFNILDLIYRQKRLKYPSLGVKILRNHQNQTTRLSYFNDSELTPDFRQGLPAGPEDNDVNIFTALLLSEGRLKNPSTTSAFQNIDEIESYVKDSGWQVDREGLLHGFNKLVSKPVVNHLLQSQQITFLDLDELYDNISHWQSLLALKTQRTTKGSSIDEVIGVFPYPTYPPEDEYPEIHFLPFSAQALLRMVSNLPNLIPEGKFFDPLNIKSAIRGLYQLTENVLVGHMQEELGDTNNNFQELFKQARTKNPELATDIAQVYKPINAMKTTFTELLAIYQQQPGLLNKRSVLDPEFRVAIATLANIRQRILSSGGRAPRKPLFFRISNATRKGEV